MLSDRWPRTARRRRKQKPRQVYMSRFAGQMSRPWVGMAGAGTASEPAADVARDDAAASSMRGTDAATNASAISFGFAATAVLVSMFLLMAIFEHLIKPGLASSSSSSSSRGAHDDDDDDGNDNGQGRRLGLPPARLRLRERDASPDKLGHSPKVLSPIPDVSLPQCHCSGVVPALHCHCSRRVRGRVRFTCAAPEETTTCPLARPSLQQLRQIIRVVRWQCAWRAKPDH